jgi:D-alanine transaminase
MENKTVYLNGQYLPLSEAKVSVLDRGFLFGDGVYEVIPSYSGHLFHFQEHLERLENSLAGIRLANPSFPRAMARNFDSPFGCQF